jgi:uncharacterized protein
MHKEKALIEIPVAGLVQGTHEYDFTCRSSNFNDLQLVAAGFTGDIHVRAIVEKSEREMTVTIETSAVADFTCDICLSPVSKVLAGSFRIYYVYDEHPEKDEDDNGDEEYRILDSNAVSVDITEDVRETVMLSRPMKVSCTDNPDCRIYKHAQEDEGAQAGNESSWQESLEKLKNKYR